VRERPVLQVGVDLLDDRVTAVSLLGLDHGQGTVAEYGVVSVEAEQLLLMGAVSSAGAGLVVRVEAFDATNDQARLDVVGCASAGERRVGDLGDLRVADQALLGVVPDRVRIRDGRPVALADAADRVPRARLIRAVMENLTLARRAAAITSWL